MNSIFEDLQNRYDLSSTTLKSIINALVFEEKMSLPKHYKLSAEDKKIIVKFFIEYHPLKQVLKDIWICYSENIRPVKHLNFMVNIFPKKIKELNINFFVVNERIKFVRDEDVKLLIKNL